MLTETGVKAYGQGIPSEAELRRLDRAVEIIRVRYQRWTMARVRRILRETREDLIALEDPDEAGFLAAVMRHDRELESALARMMAGIYPMAESLVIPDDVIKAMTVPEHKAEDARIWALVSRIIGASVQDIDKTTLHAVRQAYIQSAGDVQIFRRLLTESPAFDAARARTIAVTETNIGINDALYRAADAVAQPERERIMIWRTTMRLNVRPTHQVMEGVTVPYGDFFHVPLREGGYDLMLYPGDTMHGAHAENIVNCYCKAFPRYVARYRRI